MISRRELDLDQDMKILIPDLGEPKWQREVRGPCFNYMNGNETNQAIQDFSTGGITLIYIYNRRSIPKLQSARCFQPMKTER